MSRSTIGPRRMMLVLVPVLVAALALPGCRPGGAPNEQEPGEDHELQGTIRVSGAWALYPMMVTWAEEFQKLHPQLRLDVSAGGAGKGMADALAGLVDIGMVSREIRPEETEQGAIFVRVVKDAVFVTMNERNPEWHSLSERGIRRQTFVDLWIHGEALTWGSIAGTESTDLVNVYTRSDACGAAETWAKYLGGTQEDLVGIAVYGDPGLADAVKNDPLGVGYNNLNYAYDAGTGLPVPGLRVVPIDINENGQVDPEEDLSAKTQAMEAILSEVYPSPPARDLNLVTRDEFRGLARQFIAWILTDGQQYVEEAGYIRLTESQIQESLQKLGD